MNYELCISCIILAVDFQIPIKKREVDIFITLNMLPKTEKYLSKSKHMQLITKKPKSKRG